MVAASIPTSRVTLIFYPLSLRAHDTRRAAQQLYFSLHCVIKVLRQVLICRFLSESGPRIGDRTVDNGQVLLEHSDRSRVQLIAVGIEHVLQIRDSSVVLP